MMFTPVKSLAYELLEVHEEYFETKLYLTALLWNGLHACYPLYLLVNANILKHISIVSTCCKTKPEQPLCIGQRLLTSLGITSGR